jgi:hypothetical protein
VRHLQDWTGVVVGSSSALDRGGGGRLLSGEVEQERRQRQLHDVGATAWAGGGSSSERWARVPSSSERQALVAGRLATRRG